MHYFFVIGLSYKTASIDFREQFSLNDSRQHALFLEAKEKKIKDLIEKINSIKLADESNNSTINDLNKKISTLYYYKLKSIENSKSKTMFFIHNQ